MKKAETTVSLETNKSTGGTNGNIDQKRHQNIGPLNYARLRYENYTNV